MHVEVERWVGLGCRWVHRKREEGGMRCNYQNRV
jgi:hypothetical protein